MAHATQAIRQCTLDGTCVHMLKSPSCSPSQTCSKQKTHTAVTASFAIDNVKEKWLCSDRRRIQVGGAEMGAKGLLNPNIGATAMGHVVAERW